MGDTVGFVLLGSAVVPSVLAWDLSRKGLKKVDTASHQAAEAAEATKSVAKEASLAVAAAQPEVAVTRAAEKTVDVAEKTDTLTSGISDVSAALEEMKGVFAPARVFLAIALVLLLASFAAFDLIAAGVG